MKHSLVFGTALAAALVFSSCLKDNDVNSATNTVTIPAFNLYTPISGMAVPSTGLAYYSFSTAFPEQTITIDVDNMSLPGGGTGGFKTAAMPFAQGQMSVDGMNCLTLAFSSENAGVSGNRVTDLNALVTQAVYAPGDQEIPGYKRLIPGTTLQYVVMQYNLNDTWRVRTFWPDMTFRGSTTTTYPEDMTDPSGSKLTFQNDDIAYRVVMELTKEYALTGKADIIFYNAKFAPKAPEITVVLKNLDVKFSSAGYTLSGKDLIPYMVESGALQETPRFKFNSISVDCTSDLTTSIITYQVAGVYNGRFQGQSVARSSK
jgi:hypothetical protein